MFAYSRKSCGSLVGNPVFIKAKKCHAKQIVVLSSSMKLGPGGLQFYGLFMIKIVWRKVSFPQGSLLKIELSNKMVSESYRIIIVRETCTFLAVFTTQSLTLFNCNSNEC